MLVFPCAKTMLGNIRIKSLLFLKHDCLTLVLGALFIVRTVVCCKYFGIIKRQGMVHNPFFCRGFGLICQSRENRSLVMCPPMDMRHSSCHPFTFCFCPPVIGASESNVRGKCGFHIGKWIASICTFVSVLYAPSIKAAPAGFPRRPPPPGCEQGRREAAPAGRQEKYRIGSREISCAWLMRAIHTRYTTHYTTITEKK